MSENTSPALTHRSKHYPAAWHQKVPKRVRMAKTVYSDVPVFMTGGERLAALDGKEYNVWVNSQGAVTAILEDGQRLGLKPYEFEIIEWV